MTDIHTSNNNVDLPGSYYLLGAGVLGLLGLLHVFIWNCCGTWKHVFHHIVSIPCTIFVSAVRAFRYFGNTAPLFVRCAIVPLALAQALLCFAILRYKRQPTVGLLKWYGEFVATAIIVGGQIALYLLVDFEVPIIDVYLLTVLRRHYSHQDETREKDNSPKSYGSITDKEQLISE
jgi:hypothetical protein